MILIKDLTVIYQAKPVNKVANRGINLELAEKGLLVITGPNGSGKSTLFNILSGQLPPTAGVISINNQVIPTSQVSERLAGLFAYAPQDIKLPADLIPSRKYKKYPKKQILSITAALGIKECWEQRIDCLTRQERQLVALAITLLSDKPYLLLDEPTKYLDKQAKSNLQKLLLRLAKKRMILLATHDQSLSKLGQNNIHIQDGQVVMRAGKKIRDEYGWQFVGQVLKPRSLNTIKAHKNISHCKDLATFMELFDKSRARVRVFDPEIKTFDEVTPGEYYANQKIKLPMELTNNSDQRFKTLSGGERGWSYLYLLLATKPKNLLLLYPSLNLDLQRQGQLQKMVMELANSGSKITIFDID